MLAHTHARNVWSMLKSVPKLPGNLHLGINKLLVVGAIFTSSCKPVTEQGLHNDINVSVPL